MNKSYFKKGFTLIELLVVVGILAILAVAALIAINPLEAQRRSRDSARLQDMARLSSVIEAYINDTGFTGLPAAQVRSGGTVAAPANVGIRSQNCATSWIGAIDFCDYIKSIPLDPQNGRPTSVITATEGTRASQVGSYGFIATPAGANNGYELCTYLESDRNRELMINDSGNNTAVFEAGVNTDAITCVPN